MKGDWVEADIEGDYPWTSDKNVEAIQIRFINRLTGNETEAFVELTEALIDKDRFYDTFVKLLATYMEIQENEIYEYVEKVSKKRNTTKKSPQP